MAASFSRVHEGQLGIKIKKAGLLKIQRQDYVKKWKGFRKHLLSGEEKFNFITRDKVNLEPQFRKSDLVKAWIRLQSDPENWRTKFSYHFGRVKKNSNET